MKNSHIPIKDIIVGDRIRRHLGNIDDLARSIEEVGLLHRIVIRSDRRLIAGKRRLAACQALGWEQVPVHIIPLEQIIRGEFDENAHRKTFSPSEIYNIWQKLAPIEEALAKQRQQATRFGHNSGAGKFPAPKTKGRTRDKVAEMAGVSGRTLEKIKAVFDAAKADAHYLPLIERIDSMGVQGTYGELKRMKAEQHKDPLVTASSTIRISVAAYNAAFPQYPIMVEDKGWINGMWMTGSSWQKVALHGQYPPTFLNRALALFPGAKHILHCPCGTVLGPGLTIDLIRDAVRRPQIIADAGSLPLASASMELVLSDPPYTKEDSKIYGCEPFPITTFMGEATRVLRRGGYLGMLHTQYPSYRSNELKPVALIGVVTAPCRVVRLFTIFERL